MALNKLPSNASLKEAVTQTENINTEISTLKGKLKTNLVNKGVSATDSDKMSSLIDKVVDIRSFHMLPIWFSGKDLWINCNNNFKSRYSPTSSAVGSDIYYIGGWLSPNVLNKNECYDTLSNTWSTKANMPTSRRWLTSSTVGSNIYCIGGGTGTDSSINAHTNKNECYDTLADTWSTKANMPTSRRGLTSSTVGSNIYCIGGFISTSSYTNKNECYDTLAGTWSTKASMPASRKGLTSSTVGSNIYCIGGVTSSGSYTNKNECYDTLADTWSTKASMYNSRENSVSCVVGNTIYCIGGYKEGKLIIYNECYDVLADTWSTKASMTATVDGLSSCVVGNTIYCAGIKLDDTYESNYIRFNQCYIP